MIIIIAEILIISICNALYGQSADAQNSVFAKMAMQVFV
jgi:hypothetical protein